ncbi:MAG: hypothetical protein AAFY28_16740 [Actinomycetota bacterium]
MTITSAWTADAAPGDTDSTYVPTPGCRAFDFRPTPNQVGPRTTPLGAGEVYTQQITGDVGDCIGPLAIPADAVAIAMNVTAVNPTAQTNLRLFPADLAEVPLLSNLNVSAGQAPFPNKVDVTLSPSGAINIYNFKGTVSVVGDIVGYYTNSSLTELNARLAAVEALASSNDAGVAANAAGVAANAAGVAALGAAQPFIKVSEAVSDLTAQPTPTEIRSVAVTAPVDGQVAALATGWMSESTNGESVSCGLMDSVTAPPTGEAVLWDSPTGASNSHISASRVFDIAAGETLTVFLVCLNTSGGTTFIGSPRVTAVFTPAP